MKKILSYIQSKFRSALGMSSGPQMIELRTHRSKALKNTRVGSSNAWVGREKLDLGNNVFIGQFNFIEASNGVTIEEGCQITNFISILSHSSHDSIRLYGAEYRNHTDLKGYLKGQVHIGKYCFVGPHCTIMPNTRIGMGSIISAYSMVQGEYPDFSIIAGNPAKVVGSTRDRDAEWLEKHPELKAYYKAWAEGN